MLGNVYVVVVEVAFAGIAAVVGYLTYRLYRQPPS